MYKQNKTWNTKFNRLLATNERQKKLKQTMLREKLLDKRSFREKKNVPPNISTYSQVKRNESNNLDVYMKNYKHRYSKKKGLSKLDCYYENKVFQKINHICDIPEKMQHDKKRAKRFFLKKYGIGIILFALIPALGLIFPMLFGITKECPGMLGICSMNNHEQSGRRITISKPDDRFPQYVLYEKASLLTNFRCFNAIITFIMITIILFVTIYILVKLKKYDKLKAGKGK